MPAEVLGHASVSTVCKSMYRSDTTSFKYICFTQMKLQFVLPGNPLVFVAPKHQLCRGCQVLIIERQMRVISVE